MSNHESYLRNHAIVEQALKPCGGPWMPADGFNDLYGPLQCEAHGVYCSSPEVVESWTAYAARQAEARGRLAAMLQSAGTAHEALTDDDRKAAAEWRAKRGT